MDTYLKVPSTTFAPPVTLSSPTWRAPQFLMEKSWHFYGSIIAIGCLLRERATSPSCVTFTNLSERQRPQQKTP